MQTRRSFLMAAGAALAGAGAAGFAGNARASTVPTPLPRPEALGQPAAAAAASRLPRVDSLVVIKHTRELHALRAGSVVRSYRVALGRVPVGHKTQQGDQRTPEGRYFIDRHHAASNFHRALGISYPSAEDRAQARVRGVSPGGNIMIHGLPNGRARWLVEHPDEDWTQGCIAVRNDEIEELFAAVELGTPILIQA